MVKLTRRDFDTRGRLKISTSRWLLAQSLKYCPRHRKGKGSVLSVSAFLIRGKSGRLCGYCAECMDTYQHGRYMGSKGKELRRVKQ